MYKHRNRLLTASALGVSLALSGCGLIGGDEAATGSAVTSIKGKVTLAGVVGDTAAKPFGKAPHGKPGSVLYKQSLNQLGGAAGWPSLHAKTAFANAEVFLYDADHPEWTGPVANTTTDATGAYTLDKMSGAADNGNAYVDGTTIPKGHYTLIASDYDPTLGQVVVAIQNIAQDFEGAVTGNDLEAVPSDVSPTVVSVVGQEKNTDGTETYGSADVGLAPNGHIQVAFNMPMARETVVNGGISISPTVAGTWEVSPDWMTATFYPTTTLTASTAYTVIIKGDDEYQSSAVKNVYGNRLEATATGTFTTLAAADTTAPTLTFAPTGTGIDAGTSLKITSGELLDVSRLNLAVTPKLGSKPLVNYTKDGSNYVYELVTSATLTAGSRYTGKISGIKDLAGNTAADIAVDFTVASSVDGVTALSSDADVAAVQTAAADLFKKWVAAMNEHNLTKWQGLTAGHFAMDYNLANGFDGMDINRDGAYSLDEFSGMLKFAFNMWDSCGTTLVGEIVDDPAVATDGISVDAANGIADFAFKLTGTSTVGGQDCAEATPEDTFYATVRKISGVWKVEHASEGIDTRDTVAGQLTAIKLVGPAEDSRIGDGTGKGPAFSKDAMNDNGTPDTADDTVFAATGTPLKFEWTEVAAATAYVFIVMDANNPDVGMAMVLPSDKTVLDFADPAMENGSLGAEVGEDFGFHGEFHPTPGSPLLWQIAALGTATVDNVKAGRTGSLAKDLIAVSKLRRILLEGVPMKMKVKVEAGTTPTEVKYNEMYEGFKLDGVTGNDGTIKLTVTTEMMENIAGTALMAGISDNQGFVRFEGVFRGQQAIDFDPDTNPNVVAGTVVRNDLDGNPVTLNTYTVVINNLPKLGIGWNRFEVMDHVTPNASCPDCGGNGDGLGRRFQVHTDVGVAPIIAIDKTTGVKDDVSATALVGDDWNFFKATTGAKNVTITGSVRTEFAAQGDLNVNLWNDELRVNTHVSVPVKNDGTFTLSMDIYKGRNWVNIDGQVCNKVQTSNCPRVSTNLGIETDTGATYVPPIEIVSIALASDTTKTLAPMESFGNFSRYDASTFVTATDATVIISGKMEYAVDAADKNRHPNFGAGGEGGWQGGDLTVDASGNFSITVDLFKGFNHVNFNDVANNWVGMEIYTSVGKPVVKPTISTINDVAYVAPDRGGMGMATVATCSATIKGTAKKGDVRVNWRGEVANNTGYNDFYNEEQTVSTTGAGVLNADGATVYDFTATIPVVSGKNFVDINDSTWNWSGVEVSTTATCAYVAPTMTLSAVKDAAGAVITAPMNQYDPYNAGSSASITVEGTSNRPGRSVKVEMMACGSRDEYMAYADANGNWSVSGVTLYNGQWNVHIPTGMMGQDIQFNVQSTTSAMPTPPITVSAVSAVDSAGNVVGDTITADANNGCGFGNFSSAGSVSVSYVKVVGKSKTVNAKHSFFAGDVSGEFTSDANGDFSFVAAVYGGFNNIWMNDQEWNGFGMNVNILSGPPRPQYVAITKVGGVAVGAGVTELSSVAAGTVAIEGTITAKSNTGTATEFKPNMVSANVNGTNYSSDPNMGGESMTFVNNNDGTYSFSFEITVGSHQDCNPTCTTVADETWLWVNANAMGPGHGINFILNPNGAWAKGHYFKPGKAAPKAKDMTHVLQSIVEDKSKYWNMQ